MTFITLVFKIGSVSIQAAGMCRGRSCRTGIASSHHDIGQVFNKICGPGSNVRSHYIVYLPWCALADGNQLGHFLLIFRVTPAKIEAQGIGDVESDFTENCHCRGVLVEIGQTGRCVCLTKRCHENGGD